MALQNSKLDPTCSISIANSDLQFRADGTICLPQHKALLVADLHLGKEMSFRAGGIPVPQGPTSNVLGRLRAAVRDSGCDELYVLGDMFHDHQSVNRELIVELESWLDELQPVNVTLILGNHDRRVKSFPESWKLKTVEHLELGPFDLVHDPTDRIGKNPVRVQIGGHIHPVVKVGKVDAIRMKCFAVYQDRIVLPAFGSFTGGQLVSRRDMLHCFVYDHKQQAIWSLA